MSDGIIDAIIKNESGGDPSAESSAGAEGLMQIEPDTARTYGVDPALLDNPKINRALGTRYWGDLLKRYGGNTRLALAAYNWGPAHVDRVGDKPDAWPKETRGYVGRVMADAGAIDWSKAKVVDETPTLDWSKAKIIDPSKVDVSGVSPETLEAETHSKYPDLKSPRQIADKVLDAMAPKSPADAAIMAVTSMLPIVGEAGDVGLLTERGLAPMLARTGLTAAAGAAGGALPGAGGAARGAIQGATAGAAGEALEGLGGLVSGARGIENRAVQAAAPQAADQAAQQAVEQRLGMTAPQAVALRTPPTGPNPAATALAQAKQGIGAARTAARQEVGKLYDPIFEPVANQPISEAHIGAISKAARDALDTLQTRGFERDDLTKPTRDMLTEFGGLDRNFAGKDLLEQLYSKQQLEKMSPEAKSRLTKYIETGESESTLSPAEQADRPEYNYPRGQQPKAQGPVKVDSAPPLTVQQLRGRLQALTQASVRPGISENERAALTSASIPIRDALESVIPDEQKPALRAVNDAYAAISNAFPYQDLKGLRTASTLPELGEAFSKMRPDATGAVLAHMTPDQKNLMRQSFASYILGPDTNGKDIFNRLKVFQDKGLLQQLGFPDDFQKVGAWRDLVTKARKIYDKPPDLMQAKQFMSGVRQSLRRNGVTPQVMDEMQEAAAKDKSGRFKRMLESGVLWGSMYALSGEAFGMRRTAMALPLLGAYYTRRALVNNPAYQGFVLNGYTRAGGEAFARLAGAGLIDAAKQFGIESGRIRPDKERQEEEKKP